MSTDAALLQQILDLSREMRRLALDSEWERVHELETCRVQLIERCFPLDGQVDDTRRAVETLNEIVELDKSVLSLAAAARQDLDEGLGRLKLGRQAKNAYSQIGSDG